MDGIGLLTFITFNKDHKNNLGDWYQTAAACYMWWNHFGRVGTFYNFLQECICTQTMNGYPIIWIYRDNPSASDPRGCKKVVTFYNGWWLYDYFKAGDYDFPPPTWLHPIYTSIHVRDKGILTPTTIEHLKLHSPIGCRDKETETMMKNFGISAYFSGCMTMILNLQDSLLGFSKTLDYSDATVYIDMPISLKGTTLRCSLSQAGHFHRDPNWIIYAIQRMYNIFFAKSVITHRLHVWLPLLCSGKDISLWDSQTNKPIQKSIHDYIGGNNRFTGLLELQTDVKERERIQSALAEDCMKRLQSA